MTRCLHCQIIDLLIAECGPVESLDATAAVDALSQCYAGLVASAPKDQQVPLQVQFMARLAVHFAYYAGLGAPGDGAAQASGKGLH